MYHWTRSEWTTCFEPSVECHSLKTRVSSLVIISHLKISGTASKDALYVVTTRLITGFLSSFAMDDHSQTL